MELTEEETEALWVENVWLGFEPGVELVEVPGRCPRMFGSCWVGESGGVIGRLVAGLC